MSNDIDKILEQHKGAFKPDGKKRIEIKCHGYSFVHNVMTIFDFMKKQDNAISVMNGEIHRLDYINDILDTIINPNGLDLKWFEENAPKACKEKEVEINGHKFRLVNPSIKKYIEITEKMINIKEDKIKQTEAKREMFLAFVDEKIDNDFSCFAEFVGMNKAIATINKLEEEVANFINDNGYEFVTDLVEEVERIYGSERGWF